MGFPTSSMNLAMYRTQIKVIKKIIHIIIDNCFHTVQPMGLFRTNGHKQGHKIWL